MLIVCFMSLLLINLKGSNTLSVMDFRCLIITKYERRKQERESLNEMISVIDRSE